MKKYLPALAVALSAVSVFAEGEPATADSAVNAVISAVTAFASSALTAVVPIGVAFVAFFLVRMGIRIVKSIASSAK